MYVYINDLTEAESSQNNSVSQTGNTCLTVRN